MGCFLRQIEVKPKEGAWSVHETIEHVLYWERNSIDALQAEYLNVPRPAPPTGR